MKILLIGCDGYIGNALTQRLLARKHEIIGIDDFTRRKAVKNDMKSVSAIDILDMDEKFQEFIKMGRIKFIKLNTSIDSQYLDNVIKNYKPETIVNLGHIPSAPYSQISQQKSNEVLYNNIISTNNLLWSMKRHCKDSHYITIGTTGEYDHYSNIDIEEGYIYINHKGRKSKEMIYPRRPGSIYHSSKNASTYLIDFISRAWDIRCTDIQQSIVFGAYTDEINDSKIYSRLDSDEAFGTVIHRFIIQSLLGIPLTIYGEGKHQRGFISLNDSIQSLEIAVNNVAKRGRVQVWNQLSEWHSMNDIAGMVGKVAYELGYEPTVQHIESPRTEYTGNHYYNYVTDILKSKGYNPTRTIEQEIKYIFSVISNQNIIKDIGSILEKVVVPKIKWRE